MQNNLFFSYLFTNNSCAFIGQFCYWLFCSSLFMECYLLHLFYHFSDNVSGWEFDPLHLAKICHLVKDFNILFKSLNYWIFSEVFSQTGGVGICWSSIIYSSALLSSFANSVQFNDLKKWTVCKLMIRNLLARIGFYSLTIFKIWIILTQI